MKLKGFDVSRAPSPLFFFALLHPHSALSAKVNTKSIIQQIRAIGTHTAVAVLLF